MSTRLRLSRDYPFGVRAFAGALADPEFHRVKLDVDGTGRIELVDFSHDADAGTVRVVLRQPVPPGQMPAAVERLLTGTFVVERTERWQLGPDHCTGRTDVAVPLTPISADGTMDVAAAAGGSRLAVELGVTAAVPLLGAGIERAVLRGIRALTGSEHDRISGWLERVEGAG